MIRHPVSRPALRSSTGCLHYHRQLGYRRGAGGFACHVAPWCNLAHVYYIVQSRLGQRMTWMGLTVRCSPTVVTRSCVLGKGKGRLSDVLAKT